MIVTLRRTLRSIGSRCLGAGLLGSLLLLGGCTSEAGSVLPPPSTTGLHLIHANVLTIGTDPRQPPMVFTKPGGSGYQGAEIDLARALATAMGLRGIRVVPRHFDRLIPGLQSRAYDVIMATMIDSPERRQIINFVDYMRDLIVILVPKGSLIYVVSLHYLCGRSVAVYAASVYRQFLRSAAQSCPKNRPMVVRGYADGGLREFLAHRTEAYVDSLPSGQYILRQHPELRPAGAPIVTDQNVGMGILPANIALRRALQDAMSRILASQQYEAILARWGVGDAGY